MKLFYLKNSEENLIASCIKKNRKAQAELFGRYSPKMLSVCRRYTNSKEEAEEVLSNGFVKVFRKLDQYQKAGSFEGWIRKIMVNEALNYLKVKRNFMLVAEDKEPEAIEAPPTDLEAEDLMHLISQLPEGYRLVFNMYAIEGFKHKEIATHLNITESTSKSQLRKARLLLQKMLNQQPNERADRQIN